MSNDPPKVTSGTDQQSERIVPTGAAFVPPLGKIATNEQIAQFWVAREKWDEAQEQRFFKERTDLEKTDPNEEKRRRQADTGQMRTAIRSDIAREMSAEDIEQGYLALGRTADAKAFAQDHRRAENSGDEKAPGRLRVEVGSCLLEAEEKRDQQHEPDHDRRPSLKELIANAESKASADHERSPQHEPGSFKSYAATVTGRSR